MTPAERARQIDQEEFRRDSERALKRALEYASRKRLEERTRAANVVIADIKITPQERAPTRSQVATNRAQRFEHAGKNLTIREWADHLGLPECTFRHRIYRRGFPAALYTGHKPARLSAPQPIAHTHGERALITEAQAMSRTHEEWAADLGLSYNAFCQRVSRMGSVSAAINMGPRRRRAHRQSRGVCRDFEPFQGTGAGAALQETPDLRFQKANDE